MIQTIQLQPGITLRCFQDSRFKQGCLSLQLLRPMAAREAAVNALIPTVLLRGCQSAPDLRQISARLDNLYGAVIAPTIRRVGDYQALGLYCSFIDDRFALPPDRVLAPVIDFLRQLLLEPVLEDGLFCREYVESEKRNLIATIQARRNDKRLYASDRLMELMCKADSFGISRLGDAESVNAIRCADAFAHYRSLLERAPIHLFYVGSAPPEQVAALLEPVFAGLSRQSIPLPEQTGFQSCPGSDTEERLEVSQGKLAMGYTTDITLRHPDFAAMQVCNTVLGAGMTSKLFMHIREENSLCYDIGSGYHGSKGILAVYAGIDFDKKDEVLQRIEKELEDCRLGNITPGELSAAKQGLQNSLRGIHDSPGAIENYYATGALSGMTMTPHRYMQAVEQVTAADVARVAATLQRHTVYFLKGVG